MIEQKGETSINSSFPEARALSLLEDLKRAEETDAVSPKLPGYCAFAVRWFVGMAIENAPLDDFREFMRKVEKGPDWKLFVDELEFVLTMCGTHGRENASEVREYLDYHRERIFAFAKQRVDRETAG